MNCLSLHNGPYDQCIWPYFLWNICQSIIHHYIDKYNTLFRHLTGLSEDELINLNIKILPNLASDLIAIQIRNLVKDNILIDSLDITGKLVISNQSNKGSSIAYIDAQTVYASTYIIGFSNKGHLVSKKVLIHRD